MNNEAHSRLQGFIIDLAASDINDVFCLFKNVRDEFPRVFVKQLVDLTIILQNALEKSCDCFPDDSAALQKKFSNKWKYTLYDSKQIEHATQELLTRKICFFECAIIHLNFTFYPQYGFDTPISNAEGFPSQPGIDPFNVPDERAQKLMRGSSKY